MPGYRIKPWKGTFVMKLPKSGTVDTYVFDADLATTRYVTITATEKGAPVADAIVKATGKEIGKTDAQGVFVYDFKDQPKWFEDPLPPQFSDSWVALKRECRVPLLTGEKCEMPQGFYPFLKEQAVDYIYPDIAFCGGITAFMKIAAIASVFRIPVATHNVGGIHLTMASIHVGLSIMDFLTSETAMGGRDGGVLALAQNPPVVKGGYAVRPEAPGLSVELNEEVFRQRQTRGGQFQDWI